jgi:hypothetical protein
MEWFLMYAIIVMFTAFDSRVNWIQCAYEECKDTSIARYPTVRVWFSVAQNDDRGARTGW